MSAFFKPKIITYNHCYCSMKLDGASNHDRSECQWLARYGGAHGTNFSLLYTQCTTLRAALIDISQNNEGNMAKNDEHKQPVAEHCCQKRMKLLCN